MFMSDLAGSVSRAPILAGENLSTGQLASLGADGMLYGVVDPNNPANVPAWRPMQQAATAYGVPATSSPTLSGAAYTPILNYYYATQNRANAQLSNGNVAHIYEGNSPNIIIAVTTQSGAIIKPNTVVDTGQVASAGQVNICALVGGGFVISYWNNAGLLSFKTFDNTGTLMGSYTSGISYNTIIAATALGSVLLCGLSNGNFAAALCTSASSVTFGILSNTCAVILSLAAGPSTTNATLASCALSGGGFVLYYATSITQTAFTVYSNTGTVTTSQTNSIVTHGTTTPNAPPVNCAALSGGGFALLTTLTTTSSIGLSVAVYNAAGAQQGTTLSLDSTSTNPAPTICATTDGNFCVAWVYSSSNLFFAKVGANGGQIGTTLNATVAGTITTSNAINIAPQTDGGAVVFMVAASSSSIILVTPVTSALVQATPSFTVTLPSAADSAKSVMSGVCFAADAYSPGTTFVLSVQASNEFYCITCAYQVQKAQLLGAVQAGVSAGNPANCQYLGKIPLAAAFFQPYQADTCAATVMSVVGNKATFSPVSENRVSGYIGGVSGSGSLTFTAPVNCMVNINWADGSSTISVNGIQIVISSTAVAGTSTFFVAVGATVTISSGSGSSFIASYAEI